MKKAVIALGIVLVLLVGAILALPALVPAEQIKQQVAAQVRQATGRDLTIDGKVSVSVLPSLAVEVANVALSNPPGFSTKDMVRLGALDVKLKLLPILTGSVEVDSFVLVDPVVTLETDRRGRANWDFTPPAPARPATAGPGGPTDAKAAPASGGGTGLGELKLGQVGIRNGRLVHIDGRAGTREEITDITLAVSLPGLDSPLSAKGGLTWRGQAIDLALEVARPRALLEGGNSAAGLTVAAKPVRLSFTGEATGGAKPAVGGALDLSVASVRDLVQWTTGKPLALEGSGMGPLALKGTLAAGGTRVALSQATISLDAIKAQGDVAVETRGPRPALTGKLAVEALDLNPYLPPEKAQPQGKAAAGPAPATGGKAASAAPADWSDAPLDASALTAADVDFALSAGSITIRAIEIGKSALHLVLANGRMVADLEELALYDGVGKGRLAVDGSQPGIGLEAAFSLKGVQAQRFLTDATGFETLEGTGSADLRLSGRGRTERQLVSSLNGAGGVTFLDGAIKGINLAAMARNVTSAFTDTSGTQKTDFAELSGTFAIASGMASNKDLMLKSPLLRVEGAGTVDLPRRALKYRVEPKAVASLEGQGGRGDLEGIMVPVIVEGPWHALTYRPDLEALVKDQAQKAIQDVLGGGKPSLLPLQLPGGLFGR